MMRPRIYSKTVILAICLIFPLFVHADEKLKFAVVSPAFTDNGGFPVKFTCHGSDTNPPLELKNIPLKTKSIALTLHDPDAPEGVWVHWVVYNIKPDTVSIPENTAPGRELFNDFGKYNYRGPCPVNEKEHHYIFHVYALDRIMDDINEGATMKDLEKAIRGHILAQAQLTGVYRKPVW